MVERAFGITCAKWRTLLKSIRIDKLNATSAVQAVLEHEGLTHSLSRGVRAFIPGQHSMVPQLVPKASGKNFFIILPVWNLCHGNKIMLYLKIFYNITASFCLTHIQLNCC